MSDHTSKLRLREDGPEYTIVLKDGLRPAQAEPGLYQVRCDSSSRRLEVTRATAVGTHHAAVNGIQNNLDRAALVMFDKVDATADLQRGRAPTTFTLFHVPTRGLAQDCRLAGGEIGRCSSADAKALSTVLEATSRSGQHVDWSVHSRGAAVFDAAVRDCTSRGVKLEHQCVAVYNGAINNIVMKHDLSRAGVEPLGRGFYNHPFDPVPQVVGGNSIHNLQTLAALYNARTVATADQSLHTWHRQLNTRDYNSVPPEQWEIPGVDLREPAGRAAARAPALPALSRGLELGR